MDVIDLYKCEPGTRVELVTSDKQTYVVNFGAREKVGDWLKVDSISGGHKTTADSLRRGSSHAIRCDILTIGSSTVIRAYDGGQVYPIENIVGITVDGEALEPLRERPALIPGNFVPHE